MIWDSYWDSDWDWELGLEIIGIEVGKGKKLPEKLPEIKNGLGEKKILMEGWYFQTKNQLNSTQLNSTQLNSIWIQLGHIGYSRTILQTDYNGDIPLNYWKPDQRNYGLLIAA